jgi:hypothetical protein
MSKWTGGSVGFEARVGRVVCYRPWSVSRHVTGGHLDVVLNEGSTVNLVTAGGIAVHDDEPLIISQDVLPPVIVIVHKVFSETARGGKVIVPLVLVVCLSVSTEVMVTLGESIVVVDVAGKGGSTSV